MNDDGRLLVAQQHVQTSMEELISSLLADASPSEVWEAEFARVRFESEAAWEHCNAFLLAFTAARFVPVGAAPPRGDFYGEFVGDFVDAARRGDADRAINLWTNPPTQNPRASASVKQTTLASEVLAYIRTTGHQSPGPLVPVSAPYPVEVWIEFTTMTDAVDVGGV